MRREHREPDFSTTWKDDDQSNKNSLYKSQYEPDLSRHVLPSSPQGYAQSCRFPDDLKISRYPTQRNRQANGSTDHEMHPRISRWPQKKSPPAKAISNQAWTPIVVLVRNLEPFFLLAF